MWPFVLGAVAAAGLCFLGVSVWALRSLGDALGGNDAWTESAIPLGKVGPLFGLKAPPPPPLRARSRQFGFQDPVFEVALEYEPTAAASYLSAAGLTVQRGLPVPGADLAVDMIRALSPPGAALTAARVDGLADELGGDGGFVALYRSGFVVEGGGTVWLVLSAFGT